MFFMLYMKLYEDLLLFKLKNCKVFEIVFVFLVYFIN